MKFFETSALNGKNIDKLFHDTIENIIKRMENNYFPNLKDYGIESNNKNNNKIELNKNNKTTKKKNVKF